MYSLTSYSSAAMESSSSEPQALSLEKSLRYRMKSSAVAALPLVIMLGAAAEGAQPSQKGRSSAAMERMRRMVRDLTTVIL